MFAIFLMFILYGLITFDLSIQELKKLLSTRNEGFTFNMMQDLDQRLENRISNLKELSELQDIRETILESNLQFERLRDVKKHLNITETQIQETELTPFLSEVLNDELSNELKSTIEFYRNEYNFDVFEALFITNKYGVNVAIGTGITDVNQSNTEWWQIARDHGSYYGSLQFSQQYGTHVIPIAFKITDINNNFLGVMHIVLSLNDVLEDFDDEAELINNQHRNVVLLDNNGRIIFSQGIQDYSESVPYFDQISKDKDVGFFELEDLTDDIKLVSFAKSTGYKSFEGFDWVVVIEQDSSSFVDEFLDMRNSIIIISIIGLIFSVILGIVIAKLVTNPLKDLVNMAKLISNGDFKIKSKKTNITEFQEIQKSFEIMSSSLEKLIETEKQLAEIHAKVKNERFRAIGELAANVAHDLKNPLGTIKTSADIIKRSITNNDPDIQDVFKRMDRAIDRISHQVQDVLNFVKTTPVNITKVSLLSLIESSIATITVPNNVKIKTPENTIEIECDEQKMEIVFINLILNAIQAIENKEGQIEIKLKELSDFAEIQFIDSGQGIPDKLLSRVFDPLVTTKLQGTGLGLSSCKNIIEQHGGKIKVTNNPTTFTITIPKNHTNSFESFIS